MVKSKSVSVLNKEMQKVDDTIKQIKNQKIYVESKLVQRQNAKVNASLQIKGIINQSIINQELTTLKGSLKQNNSVAADIGPHCC